MLEVKDYYGSLSFTEQVPLCDLSTDHCLGPETPTSLVRNRSRWTERTPMVEVKGLCLSPTQRGDRTLTVSGKGVSPAVGSLRQTWKTTQQETGGPSQWETGTLVTVD